MIKRFMTDKSINYSVKFTIDKNHLEAFIELNKYEQKLLYLLVTQVTRKPVNESGLWIKAGFTELGLARGYHTRYGKARERLIEDGWIEYKDKRYLVNPSKIDYLNKRQMDHLRGVYGLKDDWVPTYQ